MQDRKKIIITGVSRGLGRALVNEFAAEGHSVAGVARSASDIWDLQQQQSIAMRRCGRFRPKSFDNWSTSI